MESTFPIIDFSYVTDNYCWKNLNVSKFAKDIQIVKLSEEFVNLMAQFGFLYVKGGAFTETDFEKVMVESRRYFSLSTEEKLKSVLHGDKDSTKGGFIPYNMEIFNTYNKPDLKEAFDYLPWMENRKTEHLPVSFLDMLQHTFEKLTGNIRMLLHMIAIGLGLEDVNCFVDKHRLMGREGNATLMRTLYYSEIDAEAQLDEQERCGEHSDFGFITLLFQDQVGGLEARTPSGEFARVLPIKDTVVINCGNIMERMSGGLLKATKHRVVIESRAVRQCLAIFAKPDDDVVIEPVIGERSYQAVMAKDFNEHYYKKMNDEELKKDSLNMDDGF